MKQLFLLSLFSLILGCDSPKSNSGDSGESPQPSPERPIVVDRTPDEVPAVKLNPISIPNNLCSQFGLVFEGNHTAKVFALPDGKFLVFKDCRSQSETSSTPRLVLVRLQSDFAIDRTYGDQGALIFGQINSCWWETQRSDSSGIFATVHCANPRDQKFSNFQRLLKLQWDGHVDSNFGNSGWIPTNNDRFYTETLTKVTEKLLVTGYYGSEEKLKLIEYRDKASGALVFQGEPKTSWHPARFMNEQQPEFRFGREYYRHPHGEEAYWRYTIEIFDPQDPKELLTGQPQLFPIENSLYLRLFKFKDHLLALDQPENSHEWLVSKFVFDANGRIVPSEEFGTEKKSYDFFKSLAVIAKHDLADQDIITKSIGVKSLDLKSAGGKGPCSFLNRSGQRMIFVCGEFSAGNLQDQTLIAINSEGELDLSFGNSGVVRVPSQTLSRCQYQLQYFHSSGNSEIYGCQAKTKEDDLFVSFVLK